jgi:hypothetical protein
MVMLTQRTIYILLTTFLNSGKSNGEGIGKKNNRPIELID